jgi:hypothetical protein
VSRISGELDPRSRTMLCELDLANTPRRIPAGGFVQVALTLAAPLYMQVRPLRCTHGESRASWRWLGTATGVSFRQVSVAESDGKLLSLNGG